MCQTPKAAQQLSRKKREKGPEEVRGGDDEMQGQADKGGRLFVRTHIQIGDARPSREQ